MLEPIEHPLDGASVQDVFDYAARRLADAAGRAGTPREYRLAIDRFDEAYMWLAAAISATPTAGIPDTTQDGR